MALSEQTAIDQIIIAENRVVFYREITRVLRDGKRIAHTFNRTRLYPGQDLTGVPARVVAICNLIWTQAVIDAYNQAPE